MAESKNQETQYKSPNEGSGNEESLGSYESPSPFQPPRGKRKRASGPGLYFGTTDI
jgi:hypothetical protein